jgi:hypothetical protein
VKNRSKSITAHVDVAQEPANGVILAQGGRFGGWSLYVKDRKPAYTYNWVGLQRYTIASDTPLPSGNGQKVAEGRVNNTNANLFSADEGTDVGMDDDTPVTEAYQAGIASRFTGKIEKVTIEVK